MRKIGFSALVLVGVVLLAWLRLERSVLPRRSTRDYWRLSPLPVLKKVEGYIYGARTSIYLKPATWGWLLARRKVAESADTYHGKVLIGSDALKLISVNRPVGLTDIEHVVPYPVARDIIINGGEQQVAALECPCRALKADACEPRDVCLVIGEPFASFVVEHQPKKARMISSTEALDIIDAEERRGHIHTAWFKDVMHNRFYAICNCCGCCCLGMKSFFRGIPRLAHSGYRPSIEQDFCTGCTICETVCQFGAISPDATNGVVIDDSRCMGCGLCASHCPQGAVILSLDSDKGAPLDLEILLANNDKERID